MPKINVWGLRKAARPSETREFATQGGPVVLTLRALDDIETDGAQHLADALAARYVTGGWTDDDGRVVPDPMPFPPVLDTSGTPCVVALNPYTLRWVARVTAMQVQPESERYTPEELVAILATEEQFAEELFAFVRELQAKKKPVAADSTTNTPDTSSPSEGSTQTSHLALSSD